MSTNALVQKVWKFCNTLRDEGVGYGDYLGQLTYLLFLKMADEYSKPPHLRDTHIPAEYSWETLTDKNGAELEAHYIHILSELGKQTGRYDRPDLFQGSEQNPGSGQTPQAGSTYRR